MSVDFFSNTSVQCGCMFVHMLHCLVSLNTFISEKWFVLLMLLLYVYNLNAKILVSFVSRFCNVFFLSDSLLNVALILLYVSACVVLSIQEKNDNYSLNF